MLFSIQKFCAVKAAADAANWVATCVKDIVEGVGLTEKNREELPDFGDRVAAAEGLWRALIDEFIKQKPPQYQNQVEFLKRHGIQQFNLDIPHACGVSTDILFRLCTEYFISNFVELCVNMKRVGNTKGDEGLNAVTSRVNQIFQERGVFEAAQIIQRYYLL